MNVVEHIAEALMSLTMAVTPRFFERNRTLAVLGAAWAVSPWIALSYWLFTAPLSIAGVDAGLLLRVLGGTSALWALAVFLAAWHHLSSKYRTSFEQPIVSAAAKAPLSS